MAFKISVRLWIYFCKALKRFYKMRLIGKAALVSYLGKRQCSIMHKLQAVQVFFIQQALFHIHTGKLF